MKNKFRIKREIYDILGDYSEQLNARMEDLQQELDKATAINPDDRDYWAEEKVNTYPEKIEAIKAVIAHMEKLL